MQRHLAILGLTAVLAAGLTACGGGSTTPAAAPAPVATNTSSGTLTLSGTNNSGKTSFTPSTTLPCKANKTSGVVNVNCAGADTHQFELQFYGAQTAGTTATVSGSSSPGNAAASYTQLLPSPSKSWASAASGTITLKTIDATSVSFTVNSVPLAFDAGSAGTGTVTVTGDITVLF